MGLKELIGRAIDRIALRFSKVVAESDTTRGLKWDRGGFPINSTMMMVEIDKKLRFSSMRGPDLLESPKRWISGLLGKFAEGQIWVESHMIPAVTPGFDNPPKTKADSKKFVREAKKLLHTTMSIIETQLHVHVLPVVCGKEFKYPVIVDGRDGKNPKMEEKSLIKLLFIKKADKSESFKDGFRRRFKEVFGDDPTDSVVTKNVKTLDYMSTNIYRDPIIIKIMVVPISWLVKEKSIDGALLHFTKSTKDENFLFHHDDKGFDVSLEDVWHGRGYGHGGFVKGADFPVTYNLAKHHFKKEHRRIVISALEYGYRVCTPDTYKDMPPGRYHGVKWFWHNDSARISFFQDVKLCFSQWALRNMFIKYEGLIKLIGSKVKDLGSSMNNILDLVQYVLKHKEAFNDESVPVQSIVETLVQVINKRPFGLHRSDAFNVLKPMRQILKALMEPRIGTRNMKHWDIGKHHGIGCRAFVLCDPGLKQGQFGIPTFCDRIVKRLMEKTPYTEEGRRHPAALTSSLPVESKIRNDDFRYFTIPDEDASDYGADYDGDTMEYLVVPTSLYIIKDLRQKILDTWKLPKNVDIASMMPERPSKPEDEMPEHHNAFYEVMSAPIGVVHFFIEQVMHWLNRKKCTPEEVFKVMNILELGPLVKIIKGKKHDIEFVVDLPEMHRVRCSLNLSNGGKAYRLANAKIDFTDRTTRTFKGKNGDVVATHDMILARFPNYVKWLIKDSYQTIRYPIHMSWMRAIVKYFPKEIKGTKITDDIDRKIPESRLNDILTMLYNTHYGTLHDKFGFDRANTARGWIYHRRGDVDLPLDRMSALIGEKTEKGDPNLQLWIRRAIAGTWKWFMTRCTNDTDRSILELFLIGYAFDHRRKSSNQTMHGWIFSHVSAASFHEFIKLLYDSNDHVDTDDILKNFDGIEVTDS